MRIELAKDRDMPAACQQSSRMAGIQLTLLFAGSNHLLVSQNPSLFFVLPACIFGLGLPVPLWSSNLSHRLRILAGYLDRGRVLGT
ncbi:hypothetical protein BDV10DRAFT_164988 [Aspergillus recurvatus]